LSKYFQIFLFLVVLSFNFLAQAFDVPALQGPVMDQVGLLSASAQRQIAETLFQMRGADQSGPQVQIFITSSLQGESIEQVAIQIFDKWKLGDKKKDNGILFLIAPNERRMRIEVGRGLEGDLPDVIAKRIIADVVTPFYKRGEFDMGTAQAVAAIGHYINASPEQKAEMQQQVHDSAGQGGKSLPLGIIAIIAVIIWIILFVFNPSFALYLLFSFLSGGRGGGGRDGGGGSWSGGGGGSAGGGASGDW